MTKAYVRRGVMVMASLALLTGAGVAPAYADRTFTCESYGNGRSVCPIPGGGGQVWLRRTMSNAACVQGRSWGYDRRNVWVAAGCRGEFATNSNNSGGGDAAAAAVIAGIAGLAIGAAAASADNQPAPPPPPPPNYGYGPGYAQGYGPPPSKYGPGYGPGYGPSPGPPPGAYVPGWMVGTFTGVNPAQRVQITLVIFPDGRAQSIVNGNAVPAVVKGQRLFVAGNKFDVTPIRNGIMTRQVGNPGNVTQYGRR